VAKHLRGLLPALSRSGGEGGDGGVKLPPPATSYTYAEFRGHKLWNVDPPSRKRYGDGGVEGGNLVKRHVRPNELDSTLFMGSFPYTT